MKRLMGVFRLTSVLLLFLPVRILPWTTPVNISNTETISSSVSITIDGNKDLHVAWEEEFVHLSRYKIFYSHCTGDSWSAPINVSAEVRMSINPDITVDTLMYPHIVWSDESAFKVYWTYFDGDSWTTPMEIFDKPGEDLGISVLTDDSNKIHLVWHNHTGTAENDEIWYSAYDDTSWSIPTNVSDDDDGSAWPDIDVDSAGNIHVVWMNYGVGGHPDCIEVYYSMYNGLSWSTPLNISNLIGSSCYPRIAIDSRDYPHVVWEERWSDTIGHYSPYYAFYDGASWSTPYMITDTTENGMRPVIAIDIEDRTHILWTYGEYGGGILYRYCEGDSWSVPYEVSDSGSFPSIAIDCDDCLHTVFESFGEIYYSSHSQTGVESFEDQDPILGEYSLGQNFPNPFIKKTEIPYYILTDSYVTFKIYDLAGREIESIDLGYKPAGYHTFILHIESLIDIRRGIYFYRLDAGSYAETRKMVFCGNIR